MINIKLGELNRICGDNTVIKINGVMGSLLLSSLLVQKRNLIKGHLSIPESTEVMIEYLQQELERTGIQGPKTANVRGHTRRKITAYVDGACLHSNKPELPNISVAAYIVQDSTGKEIAKRGRHVGAAQVTTAEYFAILDALQFLIHNGYDDDNIVIYSDAKVVVEQVNMVSRCKKPELRALRESIKEMMKSFRNVKVKYIPREQNTVSDKIASDMLSFIITGGDNNGIREQIE
jgi:ribonuclease HI